MTAAELFEVVKDVPREAWPTMVVFVANMWAFETKAYPTGTKSHFIPTEVAELAFIGSMTAWLMVVCNRVETQVTPWGSVECTTFGEESRKEAPSLVAALAAACKEAA